MSMIYIAFNLINDNKQKRNFLYKIQVFTINATYESLKKNSHTLK